MEPHLLLTVGTLLSGGYKLFQWQDPIYRGCLLAASGQGLRCEITVLI